MHAMIFDSLQWTVLAWRSLAIHNMKTNPAILYFLHFVPDQFMFVKYFVIDVVIYHFTILKWLKAYYNHNRKDFAMLKSNEVKYIPHSV